MCKRAVYISAKEPYTHPQKSPINMCEVRYTNIYVLYIYIYIYVYKVHKRARYKSAKELCNSAKELYISTKDLYISKKELYIPTKEL